MKPRSIRGLCVIVALVLVSGSMNRGNVVPGMPMATSDITIHFHGLMVFENCTTGRHQQLVRLHSDAAHHEVKILFKGPGYPNLTEWGRVHTKGEALSLEVWNDQDPLPAEVAWQNPPFNMKSLHQPSSSLGDFVMTPDAFGPTLTINGGAFSGVAPTMVDFVSIVQSRPNNSVYSEVTATINLLDGQIAVLNAANLAPNVVLLPQRLRKPGSMERKWEIHVTNEPDSDHACGYHFLEYYKGFRFEQGDVRVEQRYAAKPTVPGLDPCDSRPTVAEIAAEREKQRSKLAVIETRPCIPITSMP